MKCPKCGGKLEEGDKIIYQEGQPIERNYSSLKCLNCGNYIDEVILANRRTKNSLLLLPRKD